MTTGDRLWADRNSRCELHIGSTAIRMDGTTAVSFLNLDDTVVQIRLSDGSIILRLGYLDPGNSYEIDTPNSAFSIKRPGDYRIDSFPDQNQAVITVRQGEGEVIGGGRSWQVISDQQVVLTGAETLAYDLRDADAQPLNDFDRWSRSRDMQEERVSAPRYVSRELTGYEDLDAYGVWNQVPGYGWCWRPSGVMASWAPYRYGSWVWIAPWGWTWVEEEPWGFAPFHYGRWAFYGGAWVWVPGPIVPRPVYAPALVAWVGGGGGVGWFPLGPREVFLPAYHVSERYVTNINVTNTVVNRVTVVNVYNTQHVENITYVNRAAPNAVTMISHETFVNARPVAKNIVNVPAPQLAAAPASVYGAVRANAPQPPPHVMNRPVIVQQTPPPEPNHFARPQNPLPGQPAPVAASPSPVQGNPNVNVPRSNPVSPQARPAPATAPAPASAEKPLQPHSLAKPAPPVRPPTPKEQADTNAKQKAWEGAHPRSKQQNKDQDTKHP
jgi:hypothetical protein